MIKVKAFLKSLRWLVRSYSFPNSYLYESGFLKSLEEGRPATSSGDPAPWMNYSFVRFIAPRLQGLRILEYGSGYSTVFWAKHAAEVQAVEHKKEWYREVKDTLSNHPNASIMHVDNKEKYIGQVRGDNIDVVIVDGIYRLECLRRSVNSLSAEAAIIIDDSHRSEIKNAIRSASEKQGYKVVSVAGLKAKDTGVFETSVLY